MDRKTNQIAKVFIKKVKRKYKLEKAILFGSRARGDYFEESDFDFILVSDDFKNLNFLKRMGEILKYWKCPYDADILCYTNEEFNKKKKGTNVVSFAMKEGKDLL